MTSWSIDFFSAGMRSSPLKRASIVNFSAGGGTAASPKVRRLFLSPARRRACIDHVRSKLQLSERRLCRVLGQNRSTQRRIARGREDEEQLTAEIIDSLPSVAAMAIERSQSCCERKRAGSSMTGGVERIWRRGGLPMRRKQRSNSENDGATGA
jgi:hypothetical protein